MKHDTDRRREETYDQWLERMQRDWPQTLKNIRIFAIMDDNKKMRQAMEQDGG